MFDFLKSKKNDSSTNQPTFFERLKSGLNKTRKSFIAGITTLVLGKKIIDQKLIKEIETYLLTADVGITVTQQVIAQLNEQLERHQLQDGETVLNTLREILIQKLTKVSLPLVIDNQHQPFVILVVGVNGSGKTTTIGKIAHQLQLNQQTVMLAAGDTFRAAAIEQLQVWGKRNNIPVVAQKIGADSAAVIFDALQSAKARNYNVVIADTAGRLHTHHHLMNELQKINRVIGKFDTTAPHETLLVLDASIGQNALQQAIQFNEAVKITGIVLTKLDGTAKGGIIFAIAEKLNIPIRFIGVGEQLDDLRPFSAQEFVNALFT